MKIRLYKISNHFMKHNGNGKLISEYTYQYPKNAFCAK